MFDDGRREAKLHSRGKSQSIQKDGRFGFNNMGDTLKDCYQVIIGETNRYLDYIKLLYRCMGYLILRQTRGA